MQEQTPMMGIIDFARLVIDALDAAGVEYMLGGALAVAAWAEARSTQDVDIVISIPIAKMERLSQELEKRDMLVPADIIYNLWAETRADLPVNAIHLYTGYKAELFLLRPGDDLRRAAFSRRRLVDLGPPLGEVYVHSPEDLILYKLLYFSISEQPKHTRDIASIILAQGDDLDVEYIERWAFKKSILPLWRKVYHETLKKLERSADP